uniref:type ISP restriction/modification enzyme n=1 Tax=Gemmatimonas sp. TaxID=1962908 RepID=UPI0035620F36
FFKKVVPKTASSLGIVYTPVEIVDFINSAVNDLLQEHFDGASLSDEGVHVLDPFTGTGTFIARMIQSGLISPEALPRKYASELHANEIMLLAYYIAAINIETAYRGAIAEHAGAEPDGYKPFTGIVLTDTFQMTEDGDSMDTYFFPRNNERADRQKSLDIRVIVGNPPYSVGQSSQNDDNANLRYPSLDSGIERTYSARSGGTKGNSLYDSYVRAIRWASNRVLSSPDGGVVGFVTNGGWLDSNSGKGIRQTLVEEFDHIYVLNLRGNARTSGSQRRKEGANVFDAGSRNVVAITILVRKPNRDRSGRTTTVRYRDVGDYLTRGEKLATVEKAEIADPWIAIEPNEHGDWIRLRNPRFNELVPLSGDNGVFITTPPGIVTNRDSWVFQSSLKQLSRDVERMINYYNLEVLRLAELPELQAAESSSAAFEVVRDSARQVPSEFSWNYTDFERAARGELSALDSSMLRDGLFRPFFRTHLAFDSSLARTVGRVPQLFPNLQTANTCIAYVGTSSKSPFGVIGTRWIPSVHLINSDATGLLARWRFPEASNEMSLLDIGDRADEHGRVSNLRRTAVARFRHALGGDVTDDDVFHYVYGVLHSPEFRSEFEVNLKKEAPRVPLVNDRAAFEAFVAAGAELMELHIGFDDVDAYPLVEEWLDGVGPDHPDFDTDRLLVGSRKMKYPKVTDADADSETHGIKVADKSRLVYNDYLTLSGIPERAHEYVLGTRSGVDWIIDRWYVKTDRASGIVNDVNQWGLEQGESHYIIDLIKRVVTVSIRTVEIVDSLPELRFDEHGTHVVSAGTC